MARGRDIFIGLGVALGSFVLIIILVFHIADRSTDGVSLSSHGDKVALVEVEGGIYSSRRTVRLLKEYGEHSSVKAIVLRIDSPGGGVAASQEIYNAVRRVRDEGKPVVVSMGTVAASGGYYIACGADTIVANPGSTTGSIGVITEFMNIRELMNKIGIHFETIQSGRFKDTGSPHRGLTTADRAYLQSYVNDAYEQFVEVVSQERGLSRKEVLKLADGRVFTGRQALKNGLIDVLGDYEEAILLAAVLGGIEGEPTLVKEDRRPSSVYDLFMRQMEGALHNLNGMHLFYQLPN